MGVRRGSTMTRLVAGRSGVALLGALMVLTACGSSGSTGNTSSSGTAACISQATQAANQVKGTLALKSPASPVNMKSLAGKSVWMVSAVQDEFNQTVGNSFIEAATSTIRPPFPTGALLTGSTR